MWDYLLSFLFGMSRDLYDGVPMHITPPDSPEFGADTFQQDSFSSSSDSFGGSSWD